MQSNIFNIISWPFLVSWSFLAPNYSVLATWMGEHWGKTLGTHGGGRGRRWQGKNDYFEKKYSWFPLFWFRPGMFRQMWKLDKEDNLVSIRQGLYYCPLCKGVKQTVDTALAERVTVGKSYFVSGNRKYFFAIFLSTFINLFIILHGSWSLIIDQSASIRINQNQYQWAINQHQPVSALLRINQHQSASVSINHWLISIDLN